LPDRVSQPYKKCDKTMKTGKGSQKESRVLEKALLQSMSKTRGT
jgi:hypothetical protein